MVSFRTIFTSALALSAPVMAALTPAQVVDNIKMLTQKSQALQAPAQSINAVNGPLVIIGQGPFPVSSNSRVSSPLLTADKKLANHHWLHGHCFDSYNCYLTDAGYGCSSRWSEC
jgi:hypothetical protein